MDRDDFFEKVNKKIDGIENDTVEKKQKVEELDQFIENELPKLSEMFKIYEDQLKLKGIDCNSNISKFSFSFTLKYKDGGKQELTFGKVHREGGSYAFHHNFTDDNGKNYTSTDGSSISKSNWNAEDVEERIQKLIKDFIFYANRHGGLK